MNDPVHCGQCGAPLDERPGVPVEDRTPCACGSTARRYSQSINSELKIRTSALVRQKHPSKEGWLIDMFVGQDFRHDIKDWVNKFRRIDRADARYIEHIVTEDGKVIKDVNEPLSAHRGHGSDKPVLKAERLKAKGK